MSVKIPLVLLLGAALAAMTGCGDAQRPSDAPATQPVAAVSEKTGAQLWSENCSRCHNIRPPESFSDAQWQALTHHMRLRADLTGEETRSITEFLQASH